MALTTVPASLSATALTLTTAAQPNITSVGTLTGLTVDDITINGSTISDAGNLTIDVAGEIILDSDAEFVRIYHNGGWIGGFQLTNNDFIIRSAVSDKDIIFKGNDGGSTITALTLDMSAAGAATFNSSVTSTALTVTTSQYNKINSYFSGSYISGFKFSDLNGGIWYDAGTDDLTVSAGHANSKLILVSGGSTALTLLSDQSATFSGSVTAADLLKVSTNGASAAEVDIVSGATWTVRSNPTSGTNSYGLDIIKGSAGTDVKMSIDSSGNVGINKTAPEHSLHVFDSGSSSDATIKVGGSAASLGLEISYDQANQTIANIVSNPTYTADGAKLRLAVDGDLNANQLVLTGAGNIGIGVLDPATYYDTVLHLHDAGAGTNTHIKITNGTTGASQGDGTDLLAAGSDFYVINREATGTVRFLTNSREHMRIDQNGAVTKAYQPAFSVSKNSDQSNIAVSTDVTVTWPTEIFDVGSDFSGNTFTAPVTGKYQLNLMLRLDNVDSAAAYYIVSFFTSNRHYRFIAQPGFTSDLVYNGYSASVLADMDANDTVYVTINQGAGASQTDVRGDVSYQNFSGYLVA